MSRVAATVLSILLACPLSAQTGVTTGAGSDHMILHAALSAARDELGRQHIGENDPVVFDTRVARRGVLEPTTRHSGSEHWSQAHLAVAESLRMSLSTLDAVRKRTVLSSGEESCTFRPVRAVVAASAPTVNGDTAVINVFLRFQPEKLRYHPVTNEPFEIHHSHVIRLQLAKTGGEWVVTEQTHGPPGTSIGC